MFYYFSKMAPTGYSITVELDITKLCNTIKASNIKFFPTYLWLITKNLNKQIEFKIAEKNGKVGYYDYLTPLYASFHDDDKTFSLMWTKYTDDFKLFYKEYLENQNSFSNNHGVLAQPLTPPPENAYTVSCVPWIEFKSFSLHNYDNKPYYFPSIEAGKFHTNNDKTILPLSITCHHATTDGYHVSKFLKDLQYDIDNFSQYM